ncbi:MAG: hypothetical protein BWX64_02773 [Acidobacteria bacterium ADurb.Bin051]|nr:MAG: hypothetical protein BWX64_02773 [Acidobacteria bacterium ADurb.Bin051]
MIDPGPLLLGEPPVERAARLAVDHQCPRSGRRHAHQRTLRGEGGDPPAAVSQQPAAGLALHHRDPLAAQQGLGFGAGDRQKRRGVGRLPRGLGEAGEGVARRHRSPQETMLDAAQERPAQQQQGEAADRGREPGTRLGAREDHGEGERPVTVRRHGENDDRRERERGERGPGQREAGRQPHREAEVEHAPCRHRVAARERHREEERVEQRAAHGVPARMIGQPVVGRQQRLGEDLHADRHDSEREAAEEDPNALPLLRRSPALAQQGDEDRGQRERRESTPVKAGGMAQPGLQRCRGHASEPCPGIDREEKHAGSEAEPDHPLDSP